MKKSKKILLLLGLGMSPLLFSQIGIKTDAPTKTLDVNGEARIRTLTPKYNTFNMGVVLSDTNGNLYKADPKVIDPLYRLVVSGGNSWNGISAGRGAVRLDFVGRFTTGDTTVNNGFIEHVFSIFYAKNLGIQVITANNIVVTPVDAVSFKLSNINNPSENVLLKISQADVFDAAINQTVPILNIDKTGTLDLYGTFYAQINDM